MHTSQLKLFANRLLQQFNLRIDSLTLQRQELQRLRRLKQQGHFGRPVFPLPQSFTSADIHAVFTAVERYRVRFDDFVAVGRNQVGYCFENDFYSSPDTEVLYSFIRDYHPKTILEIGSGNSTKIARQAILDGTTASRLISVDPQPRAEIDQLADRIYRQPVEAIQLNELAQLVGSGDILFIDSSHELKIGNDVAFLFLQLLPILPAGLLIHVHDVFLPYEYPEDWAMAQHVIWLEHYLVQAILAQGNAFEVLWPGYYTQRTRADFETYFPHARGRRAQSLWLRKLSPPVLT